jgi:integrase/recombinase XerD
MVPIGERALGWIEKYRTQVRPQHAVEPDPGTLFLTAWGEPLALMSLTDLVRRYVSRANIGKQGGCHLFRHTMATLMLEGGADIRFIQAMVGHAGPYRLEGHPGPHAHRDRAAPGDSPGDASGQPPARTTRPSAGY